MWLSTFSALGMKCLSLENNPDNCLLSKLHDENLITIFSHNYTQEKKQIESLHNDIKTCMQLKTVCKRFDALLTYKVVSELCCKNYSQSDKDMILQKLLVQIMIGNYVPNRLAPLIVMCAGGSGDRSILLTKALRFDDARLVELLLKYDKKCPRSLAGVTTIKMAQVFIDNGVDVNETDILWHTVGDHSYSPELVEFYLNHNAHVRKLNQYGSCLLHVLARADIESNITWQMNAPTRYNCNKFDDVLLQKAKLLLTAIPDMVNTPDSEGRTPVDVACKSLETLRGSGCLEKVTSVLEQLIVLFKECGGLRSRELPQKVDPLYVKKHNLWYRKK